jgi:rfaE bifunctional protein nucleotidyltransferase chain/domain
MSKIINLERAIKISRSLKENNQTLVITGGCFDILHVGHIRLLKQSKKLGDFLLVMLENDQTARRLKGAGRPINPQVERSEVLAALEYVDYILILPDMKHNDDYDLLIQKLRPDIITTTKGDPQGVHNERQAKQVGAKVVYVLEKIENKSTTKLAQIILKEFK